MNKFFMRSILAISFILAASFINQQTYAQWINQYSGVSDNLWGTFCVDENNAYATGWGTSYGGVILKTTNGGTNWTSTIPLSSSLLFGLTFINSTTGFITGSYNTGAAGLVLKTVNSGTSWTPTVISGTFGFYVIQFPTSLIGYTCGWLGGIYKTTDGGNSWFLLYTGTGEIFRWMHFVDANTGYAVHGSSGFPPNPDKIRKTTNGGSSWTLVKNFGGSMVMGGIHFFNADTGVIVGNDGTEEIKKSYDGGYTWISKYSGPSSYVLQGLNFNGNNGWAVGDGGRIHRSTNAGENWVLDTAISSAQFLAVNEKGQTVYTAGGSGRIYKKDIPTGIDPVNGGQLPTDFSLYQNYPNPFNPTTNIRFDLQKLSHAKLIVYNIFGKEITTLINEKLGAGSYEVNWDASVYSSGVYFYRIAIHSDKLITEEYVDTKKMLLIK